MTSKNWSRTEACLSAVAQVAQDHVLVATCLCVSRDVRGLASPQLIVGRWAVSKTGTALG